MENRPSIVPAVSFSKRVSPFERIERRLEGTVGFLSAHQLRFRVEQVTVILASFLINFQFLFRTSQLLSHPIDTPVIVSIFQGTCRILVDVHIIGHISQFIIVVKSPTTGCKDARMHTVGTFQQAFIHFFGICFRYILHESVRYHRGGVVSYHTAAMSRTCPFREETAFQISVEQAFLHLLAHRRIDQINEGEQTTERIPEACIGKHVSGTDFTVIRTVMYRLSFGIHFVEHTREQHGTIETGIECTDTVFIIILYTDASQHIIPSLVSGFLGLFKSLVAYFLQVQFRLFGTDERRSHFGMYLLSSLGLEADSGSYVIGLQFQMLLHQMIVRPYLVESKRLVKYNHEIVLEVLGHTAAVTGSISHNLVLFGNHLYVRAAVKSVYHHISVLCFREGKAEVCATLCRRNLRCNIVFRQIDTIIIRCGFLCLV